MDGAACTDYRTPGDGASAVPKVGPANHHLLYPPTPAPADEEALQVGAAVAVDDDRSSFSTLALATQQFVLAGPSGRGLCSANTSQR